MAIQKFEQNSPLERYKRTLKLIERERTFILLTGDSVEQIFDALGELKERGHELACVDFKIPGTTERMKSIKRKGAICPGVYSISTAKEVRTAINAGAALIFSNHMDKGVTRKCRREKIFHAAGALTPKEVYEAIESGADAVSVYPCSAMGGVSWLRRLKEMYPGLKLIPTGKISVTEAGDYLKAGAFAVASVIDAGNTVEARGMIQALIDSK